MIADIHDLISTAGQQFKLLHNCISTGSLIKLLFKLTYLTHINDQHQL